ncbi:hypothetical protein AgCh_039820 [Apium graveolens]
MRVMDESLAQARTNPDEYMLTPEQIRLLAHEVVEGDSPLPPNHPITRETRQAIVRVVVEVLNNIYKMDGPGAAKADADTKDAKFINIVSAHKGKALATDDDSDYGDSNDESIESDEDRDMTGSYYDHVPRGGPRYLGDDFDEMICNEDKDRNGMNEAVKDFYKVVEEGKQPLLPMSKKLTHLGQTKYGELGHGADAEGWKSMDPSHPILPQKSEMFGTV